MGAMKEVLVPDLGDLAEASIIEVLVKQGDSVTPEQSLITLET
ncbi:MAG TPA: biotin/lipoyl-containing protein, partial [Burkholderiales bacterium]|nr:biotin/lipoyl-containing protein [Burkholderiales bacterium]